MSGPVIRRLARQMFGYPVGTPVGIVAHYKTKDATDLHTYKVGAMTAFGVSRSHFAVTEGMLEPVQEVVTS